MASHGYRGVTRAGPTTWKMQIYHAGCTKYTCGMPSLEVAAKAFDRCACLRPKLGLTLGLTTTSRLCSALYKFRGDSSGPNCGPLTAAEMAELDSMTEAQLLLKTCPWRPSGRAPRQVPSPSEDGDSGSVHADTSDGSDDESDGGDGPAHVAQPRKRRRSTAPSSLYRGVFKSCVPNAMRTRVLQSADTSLLRSAKKNKFQAQIGVGCVTKKYLGSFDDEEAAARAYDKCVHLSCGAHGLGPLTRASGLPENCTAPKPSSTFQMMTRADLHAMIRRMEATTRAMWSLVVDLQQGAARTAGSAGSACPMRCARLCCCGAARLG